MGVGRYTQYTHLLCVADSTFSALVSGSQIVLKSLDAQTQHFNMRDVHRSNLSLSS